MGARNSVPDHGLTACGKTRLEPENSLVSSVRTDDKEKACAEKTRALFTPSAMNSKYFNADALALYNAALARATTLPKSFFNNYVIYSRSPGRNPARAADFPRNLLASIPCLSLGPCCYLELDFWRWQGQIEINWLVRRPPVAVPALSPERGLSTSWLRTHIPEDITLPVQTGDKHRPPVLVATWLVIGDNGWLIPSRSHVAQGFAETTLTKLIGAAEKLNRIIDAEWS
jgi:hypothetical protein